MKDWRKRFRSFWTAINKDYELNFETGDDRRVSGEVEDFIFSVLTTQKESFIKIIESKRETMTHHDCPFDHSVECDCGAYKWLDDLEAELSQLAEVKEEK